MESIESEIQEQIEKINDVIESIIVESFSL